MKRSFLVLCIFIVSCANINTAGSRLLVQVPKNSILSLKNAIQIPADRDRVFFQEGKLESSKKLDILKSHCELEMKYKEARITTLEPEDFRILSINSEREEIEKNFSKHNNKVIFLTTKLYLKSDLQTDILRISCSKLVGQNTEQVTLSDFSNSVGKYFRIKFR